jgi:hypothetical protein
MYGWIFLREGVGQKHESELLWLGFGCAVKQHWEMMQRGGGDGGGGGGVALWLEVCGSGR